MAERQDNLFVLFIQCLMKEKCMSKNYYCQHLPFIKSTISVNLDFVQMKDFWKTGYSYSYTLFRWYIFVRIMSTMYFN